MTLFSRSETVPASKLAVPSRRPSFEDGHKKERYQVRFWPPASFTEGKVEVVIRPGKSEPRSGKVPDLVQETNVTVKACEHPGMRNYYAALGTMATQQRSPRGEVVLQEVTLTDPSVTARRLKLLTGLNIKYFDGESYSDEQFFNDIRGEEPGITASFRGVFATHDYLAHDAPAWGMTPQLVIGAMGDEIGRRLGSGESSEKIMFAYDQAMGGSQYGAMVLSALWSEQQASAANMAAIWATPANHLNKFAGRAVVTPLVVASHVHGVLDAANEFVASGQAAQNVLFPGH